MAPKKVLDQRLLNASSKRNASYEGEDKDEAPSSPQNKKNVPSKKKVTEVAKLLSTRAENDFDDDDVSLGDEHEDESIALENDEALAKIQFAATQRRDLDRSHVREARLVEPVFGKEDIHAVPVTEEISQKDLMWRMMRALNKNEEGERGSKRATLEKKIRRLHANGKQALSVPLPAPTQERLKRSKAYAIAKEDVQDKWAGVVQKNRKAKTLSFPLNAPGKETGGSTSMIAGSFKPEADYEGEIEFLLREAGVSNDQDVLKQEDTGAENTETAPITKEEVLKRRRELARIRSLMFHYEHKMKRIKKIKSKKYRRVLKKEKEKLTQTMGDPDSDDPDDESRIRRAEQKRVEERMTLRHKNTSKWVRRQLQRKEGSRNPTTKAAIEEQLRLHEELRRRQHTEVNNSESSDDERAVGEESDGDFDDEENALRQELTEDIPTRNQKGVMGMRFMREAQEKKRKEALALLEEMNERSEGEETKEDSQIAGRQSFQGKESQKPSSSKASLITNEHKSTDDEADKDSPSSILNSTSPHDAPADKTSAPRTLKKRNEKGAVGFGFTTKLDGRLSADTNPWLNGVSQDENQKTELNSGNSQEKDEKNTNQKKGPLQGTTTQRSSFLTSKPNAVRRENVRNDEAQTEKSVEPRRKSHRRERSPGLGASELTQPDEELLRMQDISQAFAGVGGAEQSEFDAAKKSDVERNMPTARSLQAEVLPGWGTWDGAGMHKAKRRKTETPFAKAARERLEAARATAANKRTDREMRHVILNEKRIKQATDLTLSSVPFPFTSREQWEREVDTSICRETVSGTAFRDSVARRVKVTPGTVIEPIRQTSDMKAKRGKRGIIEMRKQRSEKRSRARRGLMT